APAGMLALPPGRIVATFALGGAPTGAPGTGVVVVVPSSCPAADAAAISESANNRPANASPAGRRGVRDGDFDLIPPPIPPCGWKLGCSLRGPYRSWTDL